MNSPIDIFEKLVIELTQRISKGTGKAHGYNVWSLFLLQDILFRLYFKL